MTVSMSAPVAAPIAPQGLPLLLDGVTYRYGRTRAATAPAGLGPLSLEVRAGEFLCVVGPSGSGKSTLLSLLAGFLRPQVGTILLGDLPVTGPDPRLTLVQQEAALFPCARSPETCPSGWSSADCPAPSATPAWGTPCASSGWRATAGGGSTSCRAGSASG